MTKQQQQKEAFLRVTEILTEKGIRPPDFQRKIGIDSQNWTNWRIRGLPAARLFEIAAILEVDPNWLATGAGEKYLNKNNITDYEKFRLGEAIRVPVRCAAQLVDDDTWNQIDFINGEGGYINCAIQDKESYAIKNIGDAMRTRIRDGEFIVVEPNRAIQSGDDVVIYDFNGRIMVKTFLYTRAGRVYLMSINESHPQQSFSCAEIDKMHPVSLIANHLSWVDDN